MNTANIVILEKIKELRHLLVVQCQRLHEAVYAAVNALLAKQIECKTNCAACENKCQELQNWLDVGED